MYCDTVAIAGAAATVHPSLYEVPSSPPKVSADVIHLASKLQAKKSLRTFDSHESFDITCHAV